MTEEKIISIIKSGDLFGARKAIDEFLLTPYDREYYGFYTLERAIWFIEANYEKKITLRDVSEYVGLSPEYFCRIFKSTMKIGVSKYINFIKIKYAEMFLIQTELPIEEISRKVGFSDCSYFIKIFKRFNGCTPVKFRMIYCYYQWENV